MNRVVYFYANNGTELEMQINQFAKSYEILQISYSSDGYKAKSCMVLYKV